LGVTSRWQDLLFIFSVQSFGLFDGLSTFALIQRYPIAYESSIFLQNIYQLIGPIGLLLSKLIIATIALSLAYYLLYLNFKWRNMCIGIITGALIVGLLAGTSNLLLLTNGSSIFLYGLDIQQLCLITIITPPTLGLIADMK
jgi:hypothetical protein